MTPQQSIFAALTAILPVIGVILPGIIKSDGQSDQNNSLITFVILLAFGGVQAWSAGYIGTNPWLDFVAVEAAMAALLGGPLKPLDEYLQTNIGLGPKPATTPQPASIPPTDSSKPPA